MPQAASATDLAANAGDGNRLHTAVMIKLMDTRLRMIVEVRF